LAESVTFVLTIGQSMAQLWQVIAGLILGGVIAAPLAAYVCKKLPTRTLMIGVGCLIILLSVRTICLAL
ncbi:MAG: sulfite exporter TauE/SafE family protein, partial [Anaerolineae bacterium]